jgi:hypothetical protein
MQASSLRTWKARSFLLLMSLGAVAVHAAGAADDPYPFVGSWQGVHKESSRVGVGTCILISSNWVLTAAHVAKPLINEADDRVIRITFPGDVKRVAVSAVRVEDQDIALAKLDEPVTQMVSVALQSLSLTRQQHGMIPLVIVGTSGGRRTLQGHRAYGDPPLMLRIPNEKLTTGRGGDSGGAWLLKQAEGESALLIGVLIGGVQLNGKEYGRAIQPAAYREWINKTLAATGDAAVWKELPKEALEESLAAAAADRPFSLQPQRPVITKKGTVDLDLCETTPFVFNGKAYRLEWDRPGRNKGNDDLRIRDQFSNDVMSHFGTGHRFPCAFVKDDTVYVYGTKKEPGWYAGYTLTLFTSKDLLNWEESTVLDNHGKPDTAQGISTNAKAAWGFCNTSVCKAGDRYVMSIDRATNVQGYPGRFLESKDLRTWTVLPPEQQFNLGRMCAPHCLRWHNGWFYVFYLEAGKPTGYEQYITRSRDLIHWTPSPLNPMLAASPEDKLIANPKLNEEQRKHIAGARNCNNSDVDMFEYQGKTILMYCWGNQVGIEFIATAEFAGTEQQFCESWFPPALQHSNAPANSSPPGVPLDKSRTKP